LKPRQLFLLGVVAGAVAVATSFALRILFNVAYLPELAASAVFSLVPGFLESRAVESLGPLAKETTYAAGSVILVFVLGLVPVGLGRAGLLPKGKVSLALSLAVSSYLLMLALGGLFLALTQVSTQQASLGSLAVGLLFPGLVFGALMGAASLASTQPPKVAYPMERMKRSNDRKRRLFIKGAVATAVAATILYYGVGFLLSKQTSQNSPGNSAQEASQILAAQVTPNSDFYRVDVNVFAPSVDVSKWTLQLHGLVNTPMTLTYSQLLAMPSVEEYATLECVSNQVGEDLMSTALWKGVKLGDLLNTAGVSSQADYVVFKCYDGYDVGIPLERATAEGTILATDMNGVPLPAEHGYPLRAIVPGLYGMMNAKWITDIELVSGTYEGFWQRRGWTNVATYQTGSTIITPGSSLLRDRFSLPSGLVEVAGSQVPLVGMAFAGDRGIQKVEVSTDGGASWQTASLYDPLSKYTWVFWKLDWNPTSSGLQHLVVRATDGNGNTQVATMSDPFPNGATGYDVVDVVVSGT
jgi:DMSO/TMAO reductase YedYZ molybdopterin-dependent catalytic subunit